MLQTLAVVTIVPLFYSTNVKAEGQKSADGSCNWYCWVEGKIATLLKEIDEIYGMLVGWGA